MGAVRLLLLWFFLGLGFGEVFVASPAQALASSRAGVYTLDSVATTLDFGAKSVKIDVPCSGSVDGGYF